jgi:hypothetical protein
MCIALREGARTPKTIARLHQEAIALTKFATTTSTRRVTRHAVITDNINLASGYLARKEKNPITH